MTLRFDFDGDAAHIQREIDSWSVAHLYVIATI